MNMPPTPIEITIGAPARAASELRHLGWSIAGSNAVHVALLAAACALPMDRAAWMLSAVPYSPPSGDNTVQITAAFLDSGAASASDQDVAEPVPIQVLTGSEGTSELAPQLVEVAPQGQVPAPREAVPESKNLEEAAGAPQPLAVARRAPADQPPDPALTPAALPRELASSTPSRATAAVAAPPASGAQVDSPPTFVSRPFPVYPPELLARRIEAKLVLRLRIAADGTVAAAAIHRSSGYDAMDQAALAGVREWKFKPAVRDGKNVETVVLTPFSFVIRE